MGLPDTGPLPLDDHWWWRPGWRPGRRMWTWHVTFDGARALHRLAAAHRAVLDVPQLDVVPDRWLHLTTQGFGFTDEVTDDDVDAVVAAAGVRLAGLTPFDVELGPVRIFGAGAALPAEPVEPLRAVHRELRGAIADVWGADRVPGDDADDLRPHVSLAYSSTTWDASAIVGGLEGVEPATARVRISEVQLIRLGRDEHLYRWDDARTVALGERSQRP